MTDLGATQRTVRFQKATHGPARGDSRMPWGRGSLGVRTRILPDPTPSPVPAGQLSLGSLTVQPHAGPCFSGLSFLMWAHPAPGPGGSGLLPAQGLKVPSRSGPLLLPLWSIPLSSVALPVAPSGQGLLEAGAGLGPGSFAPGGVQCTKERMPAVSPA